MADLASTRVFGKLTVMHEAILKANAEIVGAATIGGKLTLNSGTYENHLQIDRGSYSWSITPTTGSGGLLRFITNSGSGFEFTGGSIRGDGSGLTGTASLRATGTTKADVGLSGIPNTNGSTSNFLRGDGTWVNPPNTTYSEISTAEIDAGTSSTRRTISGRRMKYALDKKSDTGHTHSLSQITDAGTMASRAAGTGGSSFRTNTQNDSRFAQQSGTYSGLRAQATTKGDVGLGNVRNVSSYSQSEADSNFASSGHNHDGRYIRESEYSTWNVGKYAAGTHAHDVRDLPGSTGSSFLPVPNDMQNRTASAFFSQDFAGNSWRGGLVVKAWNSTYAAWAISGPSGMTSDEDFYLRSGVGSSWGVDRKIWHDGNIGSQRLDLLTASYASTTASAGINTSASAVVRVSATANRTLTLNSPPANNRVQVLTVLLTGNSGTITWPSSIRWRGGTSPDLYGAWTAVTLMWAGDGHWYGFVNGGAD